MDPSTASRRLLATVTGQRVAQRVFERTQPLLVVPPLVESLAENRLAHLLRARRAYAALGLVKIDAGGLELEVAEVEDSPHVAVQVIDDVFMLHSEYPARQHLVPVSHQLEIRPVVARDALDAIGEFLAARVELLQVAEATRQGFAPRVDDLRIRQHQVYQADVPEIVRHLVNEVWLAHSVDPRVRQVLLPEAPELLDRHVLQHARVTRVVEVRITPLQLHGHAGNIAKLLRTLHPRVRGEDLFDQGRAGARQTEYEDRLAARHARA